MVLLLLNYHRIKITSLIPHVQGGKEPPPLCPRVLQNKTFIITYSVEICHTLTNLVLLPNWQESLSLQYKSIDRQEGRQANRSMIDELLQKSVSLLCQSLPLPSLQDCIS